MTNETHTPTSLGAVFTRPWAANLVLDMAGYLPENDLAAGTAVEPSCGGEAFITAMVHRLAASCSLHGRDLASATAAIWARDLDPAAVQASRNAAVIALRSHGVEPTSAEQLAGGWIQQGDFLLETCPPADWVVGNPPYVRLEHVPPARSTAYRSRWTTMSGRADVYVGFIEAGLNALKPDGVLSFICADRWMRNQYGKRLRKKVETRFGLDAVLTMHEADAFEERVAAYPAVFAIRNGPQHRTLIADADASFNDQGARHLVEYYRTPAELTGAITGPGYTAAWNVAWTADLPSWPSGAPETLALISSLERQHPTIGDPASGITVGIGLTTGADSIYLTDEPDAVEADRMQPIVTSRHIRDGFVQWDGTHLVNPWDESGVIDLDHSPQSKAYFETHKPRLRARHIARRHPEHWYRTIDRPIKNLAGTPKLLLADLRPRVSPVLETQGLYPYHNLFWITSDTWDLQALGGLLLSDYATLFVQTYSPRMAGGALRVTAQYLRRICVPRWDNVSSSTRTQLADAFNERNVAAATAAAQEAYGVHIESEPPLA